MAQLLTVLTGFSSLECGCLNTDVSWDSSSVPLLYSLPGKVKPPPLPALHVAETQVYISGSTPSSGHLSFQLPDGQMVSKCN